ncbi:MAG TPA: class I SAM-dependent methyltransferase [Rhizomicrobium sp.]|nr:class I SAM-dependent methyltransferase [Rhizomicrobium sp.]
MANLDTAQGGVGQRGADSRARLIAEREAIEVGFWSSSDIESPGSDSIHNILMKAAEARIFMEKIDTFQKEFASAGTILELGGGQCWASCIVKRLFPAARVVGSDIAQDAIASVHKWEHVYGVRIDETVACRSYAVPFPDSSVDLIFAFAAAHHFGRFRSTLAEISRVLKPGGTALFLHEPGCRQYLYRVAHWRVNRKRPEVPEDVIVYKKVEAMAGEVGLTCKAQFAPTLTNRTPRAMFYYYVLNRLPWLQHVLPCSVDIVVKKPGAGAAARRWVAT